MLTNDARADPGAIAAAVARRDAEPDLRALGGPIVLRDGRLRDAGGIVWRAGRRAARGRPRAPRDAAALLPCLPAGDMP